MHRGRVALPHRRLLPPWLKTHPPPHLTTALLWWWMIALQCVLTAMTSEPRSLVKAAEDPSTDQQQQDATLAPPLGQAPVFW